MPAAFAALPTPYRRPLRPTELRPTRRMSMHVDVIYYRKLLRRDLRYQTVLPQRVEYPQTS